jgi:hypothetical protein
VQNGESQRFSPRPAESWVEIEPRTDDPSSDKAYEPYVFYDQTFIGGMPVPVLSCQARDWPESADAADIRIRFKLHTTPPDRTRRLRDTQLGEQPDDNLELSLAAGGTARFAVDVARVKGTDDCQVVVLETHVNGNGDLAPAKVELSEPPDAISRKYYAAENKVQHVFLYKGISPDQLQRNCELRLTKRETIEAGAAIVDKPIKVRVAVRNR